MHIHIHLHDYRSDERFFSLLNKISMDQAELAVQLTALKEQTQKANAEIVAKIATLEQAITDAGNVSPAVEAALADLKASIQTVDDIVLDAPPAE